MIPFIYQISLVFINCFNSKRKGNTIPNVEKGWLKMKKVLQLSLTLMLVGFLAACGSNDNNNKQPENNTPNNTVVDQNGVDNNTINNEEVNESNLNKNDETNNGVNSNESVDSSDELDMNEQMSKLSFAEIEVEVDYGDDKEYEAEVEKKATGDYEAEIEDELTNTNLKGEEAFNHLYPILEKLNITKDSAKEEVINEVLSAFDLEENYQEIEIEITFHDGTELEVEDEK